MHNAVTEVVFKEPWVVQGLCRNRIAGKLAISIKSRAGKYMSKKLIVVLSSIFVILILIVGSITFLPQSKSETINQDKAVQQDSGNTQNVSLIINFGNNESVNYSTIPNKDQTAYTLLVEAASTNNLMLSTKQYDFGVFVEAIGDYKNSDEKAWIYYINGESATVAADNSELINGDFVEWKYEEPNY